MEKVTKNAVSVLIKARMTAIGPYVVVFWTLNRLVLVRKDCDVAFSPYSQSNMAGQAFTCSCVHQSPGYCACRLQLTACLGRVSVTRVEPLHL